MKHIIFIIAVSLIFSSCGMFKSGQLDDENKTAVKTLSKSEIDALNLKDGLYAKMTTSKGDIILMLEYEKTPLTVANFAGLAQGVIPNTARQAGEPYYDGLKFHRVIKNFMIQGGDPKGNGRGGPGYQFKNEIVPDLKHDKAGILAMANAGKDTNGSQFYITHLPTPHLDGGYTVFGHVVQGQDVVNAIEKGDTIESVVIFAVGKSAKKFDPLATFNELKDK